MTQDLVNYSVHVLVIVENCVMNLTFTMICIFFSVFPKKASLLSNPLANLSTYSWLVILMYLLVLVC